MSINPQDGSKPSVVLVHGAWADGSGWRGVYDLLRQTATREGIVEAAKEDYKKLTEANAEHLGLREAGDLQRSALRSGWRRSLALRSANKGRGV